MQYVHAVRKLCDLVEVNFCNLTSLGVSPDPYEKLLAHLLIEKI